MELCKNIFFNTDKLTQNSVIKISYTGELFQNNSSEVYIHYGFGLDWSALSEVKMLKTDIGFQAEIQLLDSDTFNFCFRNQDDIWDNNSSMNYIFPLEKVENSLILKEEPLEMERTNKLRKTYLWSKKIRIAIYKVITYFPKIISGNYRRKVNE